MANIREEPMTRKKWWIKERNNPQLGTYYVALGQLSAKDAKKYENPVYGYNSILPYESEAAYRHELERLKANGMRVQ